MEKAAREMASKEALAKGEEMLSLAYRASEQVQFRIRMRDQRGGKDRHLLSLHSFAYMKCD